MIRVEEKKTQLDFLESMIRELEEKYKIELRKKQILKNQSLHSLIVLLGSSHFLMLHLPVIPLEPALVPLLHTSTQRVNLLLESEQLCLDVQRLADKSFAMKSTLFQT